MLFAAASFFPTDDRDEELSSVFSFVYTGVGLLMLKTLFLHDIFDTERFIDGCVGCDSGCDCGGEIGIEAGCVP